MVRKSETEGDRTKTAERVPPDGEEAAFVDRLSAQFAELKTQLVEIWNLKVAEVKLSLWRQLFLIVAVVLGVIFVAALLGAAAYFLTSGLADALASATSSRALGSILAATAVLLVIGAGLLIARKMMTKKAVKAAQREACDDRR